MHEPDQKYAPANIASRLVEVGFLFGVAAQQIIVDELLIFVFSFQAPGLKPSPLGE